MARYRKIDVRIWGDEKFQRLTKPQPCGQSLFQYLLACPSSTSVPGLFRAGRAQLAEELEWSLEGFDKAFAELSAEGLVKADWKARVVWIPGSRKYNAPESPNVVKAWRIPLDEIPECPLKTEALQVLRTFCEALGKGFQKAFEDICAKAMPNPEQEQEQEPEQEQEQEPEREARGPVRDVLLPHQQLAACIDGAGGASFPPRQLERLRDMVGSIELAAAERGQDPLAMFGTAWKRFRDDKEIKRKRLVRPDVFLGQWQQWCDEAAQRGIAPVSSFEEFEQMEREHAQRRAAQ